MAKKSGRKKLACYASKVDELVNNLYENGVLHSTIFHTILFLILGITISTETSLQPIKIVLSFDDNAVSSEVSLDKFVEILPQENDTDSSAGSAVLTASSIPFSNQDFPTQEISYEEPLEDIKVPAVELLSDNDLKKEIIKESKPKIQKTVNKTTTTQDSNNVIGELIKSIPSSESNDLNSDLGNEAGIGEIGRRLQQAGAKTGDIQVSIGWNTTDDIDVHVFFRSNNINSYISWTNRIGVCGGMLDVDMNANPARLTTKPVENIFWPTARSPYGEFVVSLHNFRNWSGSLSTPVMLVIKIDGETKVLQTHVKANQAPIEVARFRRVIGDK